MPVQEQVGISLQICNMIDDQINIKKGARKGHSHEYSSPKAPKAGDWEQTKTTQ